MDPLSVVASTITVVQAISKTYKAIQSLRGLPNEFKEVNRNLPLAQDTLRLASDQLQILAVDESSKVALQPLVIDCEEKAKRLQKIFEEVEQGAKKSKDGSVLEFYRTLLLRLGRAHRVESLMQGILRSLDALATNQLFKTATQSQMAQLKEAIDQLSKVESSAPDPEFESSAAHITQNVAQGGTGNQALSSGGFMENIFGHQFNSGGGSISIVESSKDYRIRRDILQALHTSPYVDRMNRNPDRVPGTCEWFVSHDQFKEWREAKSSSMLWVSANPGCGKSVLAKYLVAELKTTECRTTCYFFFKDDFEDQRSANGALSCILHQLFTQREDLLSDQIVKRLESNKAHLTSSFDELWDVLIMVSRYINAGEIVCILDALDECEEEERRRLAQVLRKFYDAENDLKSNVNLKFLVTSRPYDSIGRGFHPLNIPGLGVIHLKGENGGEVLKIAQEIDIYIVDKVSRIRTSLCLKPDEEKLLLQELRRIPNQTYLWVYLTLELIERDISIDKKRIRLTTSLLPRTVDDAYERILAKSSNPEEAKKLLHIIVGAARPLTLAEMDLALALRQEQTSYNDWDRKPEERFSRYIRDLCGLFVNISDSKIYLLHQTAKEFLVLNEDMNPRRGHCNQLVWKSSLWLPESHSLLCQICIWHLHFTEFETRPLDENMVGKVSDYLRDHVFLDYTATNWAAHFRASGIHGGAVIDSLRRICDASSRRCLTWFRIYWAKTHKGLPQHFTTLMIASYFGLVQTVEFLIGKDRVEVDSRDGNYQRTALSWASENGFDGVVKLLIKGPKIRVKDVAKLSFSKGAKVDARDIYGRTPLSYAAWNGHTAVVLRLVKAGARVDLKDEIGGTPISYALCTGQVAVASRLLKGADAHSVVKIRQELLLSAAEKGYEPILERLLHNGTATELVDSTGRTALSYAAENGHEEIVNLLLDHGANIGSRDGRDRAPVSYAAEKGYEKIVKLLLEHGANIESSDGCNRTLVSYAAGNGHEDIVKLLLERGVNIESRGGRDRAPVSYAAEKGYEKIVKLLLERGVNIESSDGCNRTLVSYAAGNGHEDIVKLLLEHGAHVNSRDGRDRTPLSYAAANRHGTTAKLLLDNAAATEVVDSSGQKPLSYAAKKGHEEIVELLLEHGAHVNSRDGRDRTPLSYAAEKGHGAVIKLLFQNGADVNSKDIRLQAYLWL